MGRVFPYTNRNAIEGIQADLATLSEQQKRNIQLLAGLIDRSLSEKAAFANYVASHADREAFEREALLRALWKDAKAAAEENDLLKSYFLAYLLRAKVLGI